MKRLRRAFIILAITLLTVGASAQELFKTLGARNGLTSSQINCILKDTRGFMWFGTPAGLYRYDGYMFKHYQTDSQDGSSLPDSYIVSVQEAVGGDLWVETPSGYCVFHSLTESFERELDQTFKKLGIDEVPQIIYIDSRKNLWGYVPSKGIICYNLQQQLTYEFGYTNSAYAIPQGNVCSIGECRDGAVVVYDNGTIVCCNVARQQTTPWRNSGIAQLKLRKSSTLKVFADALDNIWLYGQGTLFYYDKSANTWDTTLGNSLGLTSTNVDNGINSMAADRSGHIWMGTNRHGLAKIDINTHEIQSVPLNSMRNFQRLSQTTMVQSVYVDDSDLLWVGTAKAGVAYLGSNIYKFESEMVGDITAIAEDSIGNLWFGTSDAGIVGFEGQLASQKVSAMAFTPDGSLWVGSKQNGLTRIKDGVTSIYSTATDSVKSTIVNDHINDLAVDKAGNLWVATDGGLQMYNMRMGQFSIYRKENQKLRTNTVTSLHYASGNRLLIGTSEGLIIMDLSNQKMKHYIGNSSNMQKFSNSYVTQVFEDSRGLIWVGTREGVNVLNLETDVIDIITEKQELCNNNILGIAEDKNKNVWVTTTSGVTRMVLQRNHEDGTYSYGLYNYSSDDGLQSDEFNPGSIITLHDGNVAMGGIYGISRVREKSENESNALPSVMFTQLFIGEEEIFTGHEYGGRIILPQALNESNSIRLHSSQNTFTIRFAAGNYNQSERLQFMYWLENRDNDWRNGNALKHGVTFENLSSKRYILHVKAISADGFISNEERTIEIIIEKPWYAQWWMFVIYGLIALLVFYLWKKGIDQVRDVWRRKKALLEELQQQREDIKAASDDLRVPMSRMTSIIMDLAESGASTQERDQLNALHSQMLTVITRVSDMQSALEHPEEEAKKSVNRNFEMNSRGVLDYSETVGTELTSEIASHGDSPTAKFIVVFIDDNREFLQFVTDRLKYVYDFRPYFDVRKAAHDIEEILPDLIVCKQDMEPMTGSMLCNDIKMQSKYSKVKIVLMTEKKLSPTDMMNQGITLSADDYLAKPFNVREAAMRFNKLLGISAVGITSNLIEGAETRMLENRNSSMTTATETLPDTALQLTGEVVEDEQMKSLEVKAIRLHDKGNLPETLQDIGGENQKYDFDQESFSMSDAADQQLITSIEQYVQQNMSRGPINLEEMAGSMGMGMKPFFHKVRQVTGKTPAEVVRDLRMKHACILLQRTNINMSELANNIGFATAEHFMNLFKERFGISPSDYRLRYRK